MSASNPSDAFVARCNVQHIPPDPPFFLFSQGFSAVALDTSILPEGAYLLTLSPAIDLEKNQIVPSFRSRDPIGPEYGVMFAGRSTPVIPAPNQIVVVRFQVVPGNILVNGPFAVSIINQE